MNRIFKTLTLFLLVSTVSFVYAQDELDKSGEDKNIFISPEKSKTGTPAATEKSSNASGKPNVTAPGGPPNADDILLEASGDPEKAGAKPSLWERIFGKKAKKPAKKPD